MSFLHLRRSLGLPFLVLALAAGLLAAQGYIRSSSLIWPMSASSFGLSLQSLGPVAGGLAAYVGGRPQRQGLLSWEVLSVRGQAAAAAADLGAFLVWMLTALLLVMLRVYVPTALHATHGHPPLLRTLGVYAGLVLIICAGYVIGRTFPFRLTALGVAAATYVATDLGYGRLWRLGLFFPVDLTVYDEYGGPSARAGTGQLLWLIGLSGLVVMSWCLRRSGSRLVGACSVAAGVLTISGALVLAPLHGQHYARSRIAWQCAGSPQLCLNPVFASGRSQVERRVAPVEGRLMGTPFAIHRLEQRPRGVGSIPSPGAVSFPLDDLRPASLAALPDDITVNALGVGGQACFHRFGTEGYALSEVVATQIATGAAHASASDAAAVQTAARWYGLLTPAARAAWLTVHQHDLSTCTLTRGAFR